MIYSLVNNEYQKAVKGISGVCPLCKQEVIPKCGDIKIHHWSHKVRCPIETEPMTEWHLEWQDRADRLGLNIHFYDWNKHIPDAIDFKNNCIYEFQNSPITKDEILDRCKYYEKKGFKTIWIFNYIEKFEKEHLRLTHDDGITKFKHGWQRQYIQSLFRFGSPYYGRVYLDLGGIESEIIDVRGYHDNGNGWGKSVSIPDVVFNRFLSS